MVKSSAKTANKQTYRKQQPICENEYLNDKDETIAFFFNSSKDHFCQQSILHHYLHEIIKILKGQNYVILKTLYDIFGIS